MATRTATAEADDPAEFAAAPPLDAHAMDEAYDRGYAAGKLDAASPDPVVAGLLLRLLQALRNDVVRDGRVTNATRQALDHYDTHQRGVAATPVVTREA